MSSATIGLSMIVKNEADIIISTLDKVIGLCDMFSISDTGSTDNTVSIIRDYLDEKRKTMDISYILTEDKWVNFSHNRNIALKRLIKKVDFILLLDADDHFFISLPFKKLLTPGKNVCYSILCKHKNTPIQSTKRRLIPGHMDWYYEYVVHEQLRCKSGYTSRPMNQKNYILYTRPTTHEKNEGYVKLMKDAIEKEPNVFNYRYHYMLHLNNTKLYDLALEQIVYMKKNVALTAHQRLLVQYKHMMCLFRLNKPFEELKVEIDALISLVKGKHILLEPIYCGVIILVKEKRYKDAYDFGLPYYQKTYKANICGFDYFLDLYHGKFDSYFKQNVIERLNDA